MNLAQREADAQLNTHLPDAYAVKTITNKNNSIFMSGIL